jgi:hypothetical protein
MAGKQRYKALRDAMEQLGGIEWLSEQVEDGRTLLEVSEELTVRMNIPITRGMIDRWAQLQPGGDELIARARTRAGAALVEQAAKIVHSTDPDRDSIALAKLRADELHKRASWYDKLQFGEQRGPAIQISVGSLHLDALRHVTALTMPGDGEASRVQAVDAQLLTPGDEDDDQE